MNKITVTPWRPVRYEQDVPPEYLKMIAVLAETSSQISLGLHCSLCGEDLRGRNTFGDARWTMECACRTFVGRNPTVPPGGTSES